jgi:hypothetical protein
MDGWVWWVVVDQQNVVGTEWVQWIVESLEFPNGEQVDWSSGGNGMGKGNTRCMCCAM